MYAIYQFLERGERLKEWRELWLLGGGLETRLNKEEDIAVIHIRDNGALKKKVVTVQMGRRGQVKVYLGGRNDRYWWMINGEWPWIFQLEHEGEWSAVYWDWRDVERTRWEESGVPSARDALWGFAEEIRDRHLETGDWSTEGEGLSVEICVSSAYLDSVDTHGHGWDPKGVKRKRRRRSRPKRERSGQGTHKNQCLQKGLTNAIEGFTTAQTKLWPQALAITWLVGLTQALLQK